MSKRDLGLLGYLGYKAVKKEPSKVGKELGECLIGWIFAMILIGVIYVIMTLFLAGPSIITNNIEIITLLIGVVVLIAVIYLICYGITNYPKRKKKKRQQKIEMEEIKRKQEKAQKTKKQKRKQKNLTYNPAIAKYKVCRNCGYENIKNSSKCWSCGADLTKQDPIYTKKHKKPETKTVNKSKAVNKSKNINYKKITQKYNKYERCPKCNSLVNMELSSMCNYCNYDILSENVKYCRVCATKMPSNAKICRNCKTPYEDN